MFCQSINFRKKLIGILLGATIREGDCEEFGMGENLGGRFWGVHLQVNSGNHIQELKIMS
jgi:hypothetical protein